MGYADADAGALEFELVADDCTTIRSCVIKLYLITGHSAFTNQLDFNKH